MMQFKYLIWSISVFRKVKSMLWCGNLQSPSDRKFKSVKAEILSVPTQDTYRKKEKPQGAATFRDVPPISL
jgi:hypothetical protein